MNTLKWAVFISVVLCLAICLNAERDPDDSSPTVPPGVDQANWHAITDGFGFVLRVTREPGGVLVDKTHGQEDVNESGVDTPNEPTEKELQELLNQYQHPEDRKRTMDELWQRQQRDREMAELWQRQQRDREMAQVDKKAARQIGQAQALFFARRGKKWYAVKPTFPSYDAHWITR